MAASVSRSALVPLVAAPVLAAVGAAVAFGMPGLVVGSGPPPLADLVFLGMVFLPTLWILSLSTWLISQQFDKPFVGWPAFGLTTIVMIALGMLQQSLMGIRILIADSPMAVHPTIVALSVGSLVFGAICALPPGMGGTVTRTPRRTPMAPVALRTGLMLAALMVAVSPVFFTQTYGVALLAAGVAMGLACSILLASMRRGLQQPAPT